VVLFEMLTGKMLFGGGETASDSLAAVIRREPDWSTLPRETPPHIRRLLERCLRKDPKLRLRDIGEARILIDELGGTGLPACPPAGDRRGRPSYWALVAAILAIALAATVWKATRPPALRPLVRMNVEISAEAPLADPGGTGVFAVSPDGARVA